MALSCRVWCRFRYSHPSIARGTFQRSHSRQTVAPNTPNTRSGSAPNTSVRRPTETSGSRCLLPSRGETNLPSLPVIVTAAAFNMRADGSKSHRGWTSKAAALSISVPAQIVRCCSPYSGPISPSGGLREHPGDGDEFVAETRQTHLLSRAGDERCTMRLAELRFVACDETAPSRRDRATRNGLDGRAEDLAALYLSAHHVSTRGGGRGLPLPNARAFFMSALRQSRHGIKVGMARVLSRQLPPCRPPTQLRHRPAAVEVRRHSGCGARSRRGLDPAPRSGR